MSMKLARDDRQAVLQVGSYKTIGYINLDGTIYNDRTEAFDYNTIIRLKSYDGDNWITRLSLKDYPLNSIHIYIDSILDSSYGYNTLSGNWDDGSDAYISYNSIVKRWELINIADIIYTNSTYVGVNPPKTGWIDLSGNGELTISYGNYTYADSASADVGMLLEDGEEITMLVYAHDKIGTIGGKLNIVPVAE